MSIRELARFFFITSGAVLFLFPPPTGAAQVVGYRNAVDQLIREGYLTRVTGSLDSTGYPTYPAVGGQKAADMLFYAPMVEPAPYPGEEEAGSEYWVNGFVRKLPRGAQPSERQVALHEQVTETELEPATLANPSKTVRLRCACAGSLTTTTSDQPAARLVPWPV